jgi:hypothetical protein
MRALDPSDVAHRQSRGEPGIFRIHLLCPPPSGRQRDNACTRGKRGAADGHKCNVSCYGAISYFTHRLHVFTGYTFRHIHRNMFPPPTRIQWFTGSRIHRLHHHSPVTRDAHQRFTNIGACGAKGTKTAGCSATDTAVKHGQVLAGMIDAGTGAAHACNRMQEGR